PFADGSLPSGIDVVRPFDWLAKGRRRRHCNHQQHSNPGRFPHRLDAPRPAAIVSPRLIISIDARCGDGCADLAEAAVSGATREADMHVAERVRIGKSDQLAKSLRMGNPLNETTECVWSNVHCCSRRLE